MIKAVLFDVGNVIIRWDPRNLYDRLIPDPKRRAFFLETVCPMSWHARHDAGVTFADNRVRILEQFPEFEAEILAYDTRFEDMLGGLIPETLAVMEELHEHGVPLFALTNMPSEKAAMVFGQSPVFSYFKDIIVSGDEGLIKPDPAIYALTLKRLGLAGDEILFTDDSPANIEAAKAFGLHTHLFEDPKALRLALVAAGVV